MKPARETAECLPFVLSELGRMSAQTKAREEQARALGVVCFEEGAKELVLTLEEEEEEEEEKEEGGKEEKRKRKNAKQAPTLAEQWLQQQKESGEVEDGQHHTHRPQAGGGGGGGGVRHGLLKGPRCAVCQQYCFLEQVHCATCAHPPTHLPPRAVCGDHAAEACVAGCPPSSLVYRQRCPAAILSSFAQGLEERREALTAWRAAVAACRLESSTLEYTPSPPSSPLPSSSPEVVKEEEQGEEAAALDALLEGLARSASTITTLLSSTSSSSSSACWQRRPTLAHLQELYKRGKDLGAPRHELLVLDQALKVIRTTIDHVVATLPQGTYIRIRRRREGGRERGASSLSYILHLHPPTHPPTSPTRRDQTRPPPSQAPTQRDLGRGRSPRPSYSFSCPPTPLPGLFDHLPPPVPPSDWTRKPARP